MVTAGKGSRWDEQGTVRSTTRSSNVSLLTRHTWVVDVVRSRDFLSSSNNLSSDCSLFLVLEQLLSESWLLFALNRVESKWAWAIPHLMNCVCGRGVRVSRRSDCRRQKEIAPALKTPSPATLEKLRDSKRFPNRFPKDRKPRFLV